MCTGEDERNGRARFVTVKPLGLEHMCLDQVKDRLEGEGNVTDLIGQGLGR